MTAATAAMLVAAAAWLAWPRPNPAPPVGRRAASRRSSPRGRPAPAVHGLLAAVAAGGCAVLLGGWVGAATGLAVGAFVWRTLRTMESVARRRHRQALERLLPHVVDLLAASLSVGASADTATAQIARAVEPPMREELLAVANRLVLGADPVRVWADVGRHPQLGPLGRRLASAVDSGAPVTEAMLRLGEDLRRSRRAEVEARARAVGVKAAAPLGLCLLPAFVLIGIVPLVAASLGAVLAF